MVKSVLVRKGIREIWSNFGYKEGRRVKFSLVSFDLKARLFAEITKKIFLYPWFWIYLIYISVVHIVSK